jgi:hypothetical protein
MLSDVRPCDFSASKWEFVWINEGAGMSHNTLATQGVKGWLGVI